MSIKSKPKGILIAIFILAILCVLLKTNIDEANKNRYTIDEGALAVRFVDVGQGDCEIIQIPDGRNIIIDGGPNSSAQSLISEINEYGIKRFDYVIATHPHEDHIGGLYEVIKNFEIGEVYMPKVSANTSCFTNLVSEIKSKNVKTNVAKAGVVIIDEDNITAEFLAPNSDNYEDTNNYSAVLKFTYNGISFLFTGDAEKESEFEMLENNADLSSCVLKVGHHGSTTSTTNQFLRAVYPKIAVIEVGDGNSYGHPHEETIGKLTGIRVYRTDINGTVTVSCNGSDIKVHTEK